MLDGRDRADRRNDFVEFLWMDNTRRVWRQQLAVQERRADVFAAEEALSKAEDGAEAAWEPNAKAEQEKTDLVEATADVL